MKKLPLSELKGAVDFAVVTIRDDEFRAVLQRFPPNARASGEREYSLSFVTSPEYENPYTVAVVRIPGQGTGESQNAATDVIDDLDPQWLIVAGIAGGVPHDEFTLGDVIVSNQIIDMTVGAALNRGKQEYATSGGRLAKEVEVIVANLAAREHLFSEWNTPASISIARPHFDSAKRIYGGEEFQNKVKSSLKHHFGEQGRVSPIYKDGAIVSSDTLIKDTDVVDVWRGVARHFLAIEMESAGVFRAARKRRGDYPMIAIRGISDIVGLERDPKWTAYACHTAGAFVRAFINSGPIVPRAISTKKKWVRGSSGLLQLFEKKGKKVSDEGPTRRARVLHKKILENWSTEKVSYLLSTALVLAHEVKRDDFEGWIRLELDGYYRENRFLTDDVVVPEYRAVPVQYYSPQRVPVSIRQKKLGFLTEYRLRQGVPVLERMSESSGVFHGRDPSVSEFFREQFHVEVDLMEFASVSVVGVLGAIKNRLLDWLREIGPAVNG